MMKLHDYLRPGLLLLALLMTAVAAPAKGDSHDKPARQPQARRGGGQAKQPQAHRQAAPARQPQANRGGDRDKQSRDRREAAPARQQGHGGGGQGKQPQARREAAPARQQGHGGGDRDKQPLDRHEAAPVRQQGHGGGDRDKQSRDRHQAAPARQQGHDGGDRDRQPRERRSAGDFRQPQTRGHAERFERQQPRGMPFQAGPPRFCAGAIQVRQQKWHGKTYLIQEPRYREAEWRSGGRWYGYPVYAADPHGWRSGWYSDVHFVTYVPRREIRTRQYWWHNTVYVPIFDPFRNFGATVIWSSGADYAVVEYDDRQVYVQPGSNQVIMVEGGIWYPDQWVAPPRVYEQVLYVPVQPVASGLGLAVNWNSNSGASVSGGLFFSAMW